jgi:uncharacterized protein (DUF2141 family)
MNVRIITYIVLLIFPLILPHMVHAENDKHKIEGDILFSEKGTIYIYLVTEKVFQTPLTGIQTLVVEPSKKDRANKKIEFTFHDVNDGTYGIRCFQDQNGDGKLNRGPFGPTEPWGMSWKDERVIHWPGFDKIAFEVSSDIKNLTIQME